MSKVKDKSIELEILIATMNRTSLDFLSVMFYGLNYLDYNVLVVNQTTEEKLLKSEHSNIRVINSFEKGLSKSRNLAIKNAEKSICLLSDDDIVFKEGFEESILNTYKENDFPIITFQTVTTQNKLYWTYPLYPKLHNDFLSRKTLSVEITFKKDFIKGLEFNEKFGLGAKFEDGENYIFLLEAKKKELQIWFENKIISIHEPFSSSDELESDRLTYAKSAIHFCKYGNLAYFWVFKFVFFLFRKKYISFRDIRRKLKIGFKGIQDYKNNN